MKHKTSFKFSSHSFEEAKSYSKKEKSIYVRLTPYFLEEDQGTSTPQYHWLYQAHIHNHREHKVTLKKTTFTAIDANGHQRLIDLDIDTQGSGAVPSGESLDYMGFFSLSTPSGFIIGHYTFEEEGEDFFYTIPPMYVHSPGYKMRKN